MVIQDAELLDRGIKDMSRTQVNGSFLRGKGNKQSVLVKRVMKDGRVLSGLDFQADMRLKSDNHEEEKQTLGGSQERHSIEEQNTIRRESNIVNYATNDGSDRLRSTVYISGKS